MTWSVIIPSARPENLLRCLASVFDTHAGLDPRRVVVVDDGSRALAEKELPASITWVKGQKPFVFARNVNLGAAACAPDDLVIFGDDSVVVTGRCFDRLSDLIEKHPEIGVLSPAVEGLIGNPRQGPHHPKTFQTLDSNLAFNEIRAPEPGGALPPYRIESEALAFVCVMIPRRTWNAVGPLDEQFVGYGCEDVDYCRRVRAAGQVLAICYEAVVRHGTVPSTFRSRADFDALYQENTFRLWKKWGN